MSVQVGGKGNAGRSRMRPDNPQCPAESEKPLQSKEDLTDKELHASSQKERRSSLRESLKQFLNLQSKSEPSTKYCTHCGKVCLHLPATLWLDGDEEDFTVCLPFCPDCNPELIAQMPTSD